MIEGGRREGYGGGVRCGECRRVGVRGGGEGREREEKANWMKGRGGGGIGGWCVSGEGR